MKIIVLDIETGGLNSQEDGICSISYKELGKEVVFTHYIKPCEHKFYSSKALEINGLSLDKLENEGEDLFDVLDKFLSFLTSVSDGNKWNVKLLGQNLKFDLGFLETAFKETMSSIFDFCHYHYKDTLFIADYLKDIGKINPRNLKLTTLYEYFFGKDILFKNAHTSEADVLMTERVYIELLKIK